MEISGKNLIGAQYSDEAAGQFKVWSPLKQAFLPWLIDEVSLNDVERALNLAEQAGTAYAKVSPAIRAAFLNDIASLLDENAAKLCEVYTLESALPPNRARAELSRTIKQLRSFASYCMEANCPFESHTRDEEKTPQRLHKKMVPLGPVLVFGASNFPFAYSTIGGDSASALAAACPVIVKAHPMHAGTGCLVADLVLKAAQKNDLPDGVFSNLNTQHYEAATKLITDHRVKAVGFTGSFKGGMALYELVKKRPDPIPFFAEMGSVNPVILLPQKLADDGQYIAQKLADSMSLNAGQFCTSPGLIIANNDAALEAFCAELTEKLKMIEPQLMLHPQIFERFQQDARDKLNTGALEVLCTGDTSLAGSILPKLVRTKAKSVIEKPELMQEVFGSHAIIVTCEHDDEIWQVLQKLEGQLTISLFAHQHELSRYPGLLQLLSQKAGRIIWNEVPTGVEVHEAMHHGGPYPATTDSRFTAVGNHAVYRFLRSVCFQNFYPGFETELTT